MLTVLMIFNDGIDTTFKSSIIVGEGVQGGKVAYKDKGTLKTLPFLN